MKAIFVVVGLLAIATVSLSHRNSLEVTREQRIFENEIENAINDAREKLAQYDPYQLAQGEITVLGHTGQVTNVDISGFSNFEATRISLGGLVTWTLKLDLVAHKVQASVENWKIEGPTLYGDGTANAIIEEVKLSIVAKMNPLPNIKVKDLQVTPSVGYANVSITGIYNDEEKSKEISDSITNFLINTINNDKELHDKISEILLQLIQNALG